MCNLAAHIVDRIKPHVPVRQWVLSLPWELRALAAAKPAVLGAFDRIFAEEIARLLERLAGVAGAQTAKIGAASLATRRGFGWACGSARRPTT